MSEAVTMFGQLWSAVVNMYFSLEILPGVSFGWLVIAGAAIMILINFLTGGDKKDG